MVDIYLVDNNSPDVSFDYLTTLFPECRVVRLPEHLGQGAGYNAAVRLARKAGHEFIWLLDPNIIVAHDALTRLLQAAEARPDVSIFGAAILDDSGAVLNAGSAARSENVGAYFQSLCGAHRRELPTEPYAVPYISGASLFVRASIFDRVGLLQEDWFLHFEDVEWCWRAARFGEERFLVPQAIVCYGKRCNEDQLPAAEHVYYYVRNAVAFAYLAEPGAARAAIDQLHTNVVEPWLRAYEALAHTRRAAFQALVARAVRDGQAGRLGRRNVRELVEQVRDSVALRTARESSNPIVSVQAREDLDGFYWTPDPWNYDTTPDDRIRKERLLAHLPRRRYRRTLDIGCGNAFVTADLPGDAVVACDPSDKAIFWAKERVSTRTDASRFAFAARSIFDLSSGADGRFDLIVVTGVLYPQYIGRSFSVIREIVDDLLLAGGVLASVHISDWSSWKFPYTSVFTSMYSYREYVHRLEIQQK